MRQHVDVVAHGLRFYGGLIGAFCTLSALLMVGVALGLQEPAVALLTPFLMAGGALLAVPCVATGNGLLARRPWARPAGITLSVLLLGDVPIGASLGLLGLGVLLDAEVAAEFASDRVLVGKNARLIE